MGTGHSWSLGETGGNISHEGAKGYEEWVMTWKSYGDMREEEIGELC